MGTKKKKLNVVLTILGLFPHSFGDGQIYVHRLAKELMKRRDAVHTVTSAPWDGACDKNWHIEDYVYEELPATAISLNSDVISEGDKHSELSTFLIKGLSTVFKGLRPDIVHINRLKAASISVCNDLNMPHVVRAETKLRWQL